MNSDRASAFLQANSARFSSTFALAIAGGVLPLFAPAADLGLSSLNVTNRTSAGGSVTAQVNVVHTGSGTADFNVDIYRDENQDGVLDGGDTLLFDDLFVFSTNVSIGLANTVFDDALDGLAGGNRVLPGQQLLAVLERTGGDVTGEVNTNDVAAFRIQATITMGGGALVAGTPPQLTYTIASPVVDPIAGFALQLRRLTPAALLDNDLAFAVAGGDGDGDAFTIGTSVVDVTGFSADLTTALNALADGSRIVHGEQIGLRLVPDVALEVTNASVDSNGLAQTVQIDATTLTFNAQTGTSATLSYNITSPGLINSFDVDFNRGGLALPGAAVDLGALANNQLDPGAGSVDVTTAMLSTLNGLANGSRIRHNDMISAVIVPNGTVAGASDLESNPDEVSVQIDAGAFSFVPTTGQNAVLFYTILAPALINSFDINVARGVSMLSATDVDLPGLTDTQLTPGARTVDITTQFLSILNALPNASRVNNGDALSAKIAPDGAVAPGSDLVSAAGTPSVDIAINGQATFSTAGTDAVVTINYTITSPATVNNFVARVGTDPDPASPGLDAASTVFRTVAIPCPDLDSNGVCDTPGTSEINGAAPGSHSVTLRFPAALLSGLGSLNLVATLDLDVDDGIGNVVETEDVLNNFDIVPTNREVGLNTLQLTTDSNGAVRASIGYDVTGATVDDFCLRFDLLPSNIEFAGRSVTDITERSIGVRTIQEVISDDLIATLQAGGLGASEGVQNGDTIRVSLAAPGAPGGFCGAGNASNADPDRLTATAAAAVDLVASSVGFGISGSFGCSPNCFRAVYQVDSPGPVREFRLRVFVDENANGAFDAGEREFPTGGTVASADQRLPGTHEVNVVLAAGSLAGVESTDQLVLVLDTGNAVAESNENNNTATASDLFVTNLQANALAVIAGDPIAGTNDPRASSAPGRLQYTVGGTDAVSAFSFDIVAPDHANALVRRFTVNSQGVTFAGASAPVISATDLLQPGAHVLSGLPLGDALAELGISASGGDCNLLLRAVLDSQAQIAEQNESDNTTETRFGNTADVALLDGALANHPTGLRFLSPGSGNAVDAAAGTQFDVEFQYRVLNNDLNSPFAVRILAVGNVPDGQNSGANVLLEDVLPLVAPLAATAIADPCAPASDPDRAFARLLQIEDATLSGGAIVVRQRVEGPPVSRFPFGFSVRVIVDPCDVLCDNPNNNILTRAAGDTGVVSQEDRDQDGLTDVEESNGFFVSRYTEEGGDPCNTAERQAGTCNCTLQGAVRGGTVDPLTGQASAGIVRWQCLVRTDPLLADTDGDGICDLDEVATFAFAADGTGVLKGAGQTGINDLPALAQRANHVVGGNLGINTLTPCNKSKFASGIRTDPSRRDSDGDGSNDDVDSAPQLNPVLFGLAVIPVQGQAPIDVRLPENQQLLLNFDQDSDGFVEATDANADGVPDFTRLSEGTVERVFGIDFSNDGSLVDGFDMGGTPADSYLAPFGLSRDCVAPVDDPVTRPLLNSIRRLLTGPGGVLLLEPRFGHYRAGLADPTQLNSRRCDQRFRFLQLVRVVVETSASGITVRPEFAGAEAGRVVNARGNGIIDPNDTFTVRGQETVQQTFPVDNCPGDASRPDQLALRFNPDQADLDADGIGDTCDPDADNDGVSNDFENAVGGPCGMCGSPVMALMMFGFAAAVRGATSLRRPRRI